MTSKGEMAPLDRRKSNLGINVLYHQMRSKCFDHSGIYRERHQGSVVAAARESARIQFC